MPIDLAAVYAHVDRSLDRYLAEVADFCRIPSVGGDAAAMSNAHQWLEGAFARMGLRSRTIEWDGAHPYSFAASGDAGGRSVLFFNHYDVADYTNPIREIAGERHPFSGAIEGGKLYARGSA